MEVLVHLTLKFNFLESPPKLKHCWQVWSQSVCGVHSSRVGRVWSVCVRVWHFLVVGQHTNPLGTLANAPFAKESPVWHAVSCLVAPRPRTTPLTNGPRTRDHSCLYRCPEEKGGQPFFCFDRFSTETETRARWAGRNSLPRCHLTIVAHLRQRWEVEALKTVLQEVRQLLSSTPFFARRSRHAVFGPNGQD